LETLPKYTEDGPEMLKMSKEDYVTMKAKEKGIPTQELRRGATPSTEGGKDGGPSGGKFSRDSKNKKFNAFREMEKMKRGGVPDLAKISEGVAVVGKPVQEVFEGLGKRGRDDDEGKGKKFVKRSDVSRAFPSDRSQVSTEIEMG
jgi:lupus La protein